MQNSSLAASLRKPFGVSDATLLDNSFIDDTIANEQWRELGPQAVLYTAVLIYKYWQEVNQAVPCTNATCHEFSGTITDVYTYNKSRPPIPIDSVRVGDTVVGQYTFDPKRTVKGFQAKTAPDYYFPLNGDSGTFTLATNSFAFSLQPRQPPLHIGICRYVRLSDKTDSLIVSA